MSPGESGTESSVTSSPVTGSPPMPSEHRVAQTSRPSGETEPQATTTSVSYTATVSEPPSSKVTFETNKPSIEGAGQNGAVMSLTIYLPDAQLHRLGPMTLGADAGGHALPARTFTQAGEYTYSAGVPAEALRPGLVLVNFRFDKAAANLGNGDQRELSAVVTAVGLNPAP